MGKINNYFWIDRNVLYSLLDGYDSGEYFLSRHALLLYLLYLRSANPKLGNVSYIAGKKARLKLGIREPYFSEAEKELEDRGFIERCPGNARFDHGHIVLSGSGDGGPRGNQPKVFISTALIEEGKFKDLNYDEIIGYLDLSAQLHLADSYGAHWTWVHRAYEDPGKESAICRNDRSTLEQDTIIINNSHVSESILQSLEAKGLVAWIPVVLGQDDTDKTMMTVVFEVFDNPVALNPGERVVWILRPIDKYLPETRMRKFHELRSDVERMGRRPSCDWMSDDAIPK